VFKSLAVVPASGYRFFEAEDSPDQLSGKTLRSRQTGRIPLFQSSLPQLAQVRLSSVFMGSTTFSRNLPRAA
jgi:hypothetical protein